MNTEAKVALLAVAVALVGVPAVLVVAAVEEPTVAIVEDYLNAVRDKDVDEALRIADSRVTDVDDPLRTPAAMSSDWEVATVNLIHEPLDTESQDVSDATEPYLVDAVIKSGSETARGRFEVVSEETKDGDDVWRIRNPFVDLTVEQDQLDYFSVNGTAVDMTAEDIVETEYANGLPIRVFPGLYRPYSGDANVTAEPKRLLYMPHGLDTEIEAPPLDVSVSVKPEAVDAIDTAVREHIDSCVAQKQPTLKECPYVAEDEMWKVNTGSEIYDDVEDVTWKVDEYPETIATGGDGEFWLDANNGPAVIMTATGVPESGGRTAFTATCPIELDGTGLHSVWPRATASLSRSGKATVSWEADKYDDFVYYECH